MASFTDSTRLDPSCWSLLGDGNARNSLPEIWTQTSCGQPGLRGGAISRKCVCACACTCSVVVQVSVCVYIYIYIKISPSICVRIAECITSVALFLVTAIGTVVVFAVLIVRTHCHHHYLPEASLQAVLQLAQAIFCPFHCWCCCQDPCSSYISFNHTDKYQSLIRSILWACCLRNPQTV